jgi:hypothetical protein
MATTIRDGRATANCSPTGRPKARHVSSTWLVRAVAREGRSGWAVTAIGILSGHQMDGASLSTTRRPVDLDRFAGDVSSVEPDQARSSRHRRFPRLVPRGHGDRISTLTIHAEIRRHRPPTKRHNTRGVALGGDAQRPVLARNWTSFRSTGHQRVSELLEITRTIGQSPELSLAQQSQRGTHGNGSRVLAMQKVEGSSPFIRSTESPAPGGFLLRINRGRNAPLLTLGR